MCADTITSHFHWVKPEISGSPTTWGVKLNADLDLIDNQLFTTDANATQAVHDSMQVGMIVMFGGATPPPNWKLCDGTVYNNTDIPLLAPILNNAFGGAIGTSNAVPDLRSRFPIGTQAGGTLPLGTMGGEATHTLVTAEMPSHNHTINDPSHDHGVNDPTHGHDVATNTYTVGGTGESLVTFSGSGGTTGTNYAATGISIFANNTDITINNAGGDAPHNNMPPYVGVNFIIKYQ